MGDDLGRRSWTGTLLFETILDRHFTFSQLRRSWTGTLLFRNCLIHFEVRRFRSVAAKPHGGCAATGVPDQVLSVQVLSASEHAVFPGNTWVAHGTHGILGDPRRSRLGAPRGHSGTPSNRLNPNVFRVTTSISTPLSVNKGHDAFGGILAACTTPPDELNRVDPPVARLRLVDEGVGPPELLAQFSLRQAGLFTPLSEEPAEASVGGVVLGSCSHDGNTLKAV